MLIVCFCAQALWTLNRTDHLELIERNLRAKVLTPDIRYPELVPQLALAHLCAVSGRVDEARRWVTEAHQVVVDQHTPPLAVQIHRFEAELELRLGADGDLSRFRQAVAAGRAASTHEAMAPWHSVFDQLESDAQALWG